MGSAEIGVLMLCAATFLACRIFRVPATLPVLAVALLLLQAGAISAAAIPALAQLAAAKGDLDHWTDEQASLGDSRQSQGRGLPGHAQG